MEDNEFEEYINTSSDSMFHYTKMENGILILSNMVYFDQESGDFELTTYRPFGVWEK